MKKVLLGLLLVFATTAASAQCVAAFDTNYVGPGTIFYNNMSSGYTSGSTSFYWTFQGGTPAYSNTLDTVTVSYSTSGSHQVCLYLFDSLNNCTDSICLTSWVYAGNPSVTATGTATQCGNCNGSATASVSGGQAPYSYMWSNAATTASITNLCAGLYTVTVSDANAMTGTATYQVAGTGSGNTVALSATNTTPCNSESITVTAMPGNGTAPYTYQWSNNAVGSFFSSGSANGLYSCTVTDANGCIAIDSIVINRQAAILHNETVTAESCLNCCDGGISLNPTGGSGSGYTYSWSNGATSSSISNVCPGTYLVTITDGVGCTRSIGLGVPAFVCYSMSGNIAQGEDAKVYLIEENSGTLSAVDSMITDSLGYYYFYSVCPGTYYVKAALTPAHSQYSSYLPTYYDSASLWSNANAIVMGSSHIYNIDFSLLSGTNPGGPGFVGGLISQGANRGDGDPVANAQLVLTNSNGDVVAFTKSDENGAYSISNLPIGNYSLNVDILNKTSYPLEFSVTEDEATFDNGNFKVYGTYIKGDFSTGITGADALKSNVYPNPSNGMIWIQNEDQINEVIIYSLTGQMMQTHQPRNARVNIDISSLASGQYMMEIKTNDMVEHHVIVKE